MAVSRKTTRRLIAQGEVAQELHRALSDAPFWSHRFSTATALRRALGYSRPVRLMNRARLGSRVYRRILRAGVMNRDNRNAIREAIRKHGRTPDGGRDGARLFAHVFGRKPKHPVDFFVRGALLVFVLGGVERGILDKTEYGQFFPESNADVKPLALRGAVAVIAKKPVPVFPKTLVHEQVHHLADLAAQRPLHSSGYASRALEEFVSRNRPTREKVERFRQLAQRDDLEWVKEEVVARFREGDSPKAILGKRFGSYVRSNRKGTRELLDQRWRAAVGKDVFTRINASEFLRETLFAMQAAVDVGVDRETVVYTALVTSYRDVPAVMQALIASHGVRKAARRK